tara:strand:- start:397 stop:963 length:567 start_codon:yes stop_codon:yes gene_type:complete
MAIRTNNSIFKSLRQNSSFRIRESQRKSKQIKERQEKAKQLKLKQLSDLKKESEITEQKRMKRALVSNAHNQNTTIHRTANGIVTTNEVINRNNLGKIVRTGVTTENAGHVHRWSMYEDGTIIIHQAKHPKDSRIKHDHDYIGVFKKGHITWNQSSCYKENPNVRSSCESLYGHSGAPMHKHKIQFSI